MKTKFLDFIVLKWFRVLSLLVLTFSIVVTFDLLVNLLAAFASMDDGIVLHGFTTY